MSKVIGCAALQVFMFVNVVFHRQFATQWILGTSVGVRTSMAGHVTSVPPTDNVLTLQLTRAAASTPFLLTDSSVSQHFNKVRIETSLFTFWFFFLL